MKLVRDPLLHFLLLAALLFALESYFSTVRKPTIEIDRQTVDYLVEQREELELRKLSAEERQQTVETYLEDELLYREAYNRGLDKGDSRMRRNLILKMRGLLAAGIDPPTDTELRAYFEQNPDQFTHPETTSLEQIFFRDPARLPANLPDRLRNGLEAGDLGDFSLELPRSMKQLTDRQLARTFGAPAARQILHINDNQWHGPIRSDHGVHLIRVIAKQPARPLEFAEVSGYIQGYWTLAQSRREIEKEVERLKQQYDIVIHNGTDTADAD